MLKTNATDNPQTKYSISILYYLEHFLDFEALHGWRTVIIFQ